MGAMRVGRNNHAMQCAYYVGLSGDETIRRPKGVAEGRPDVICLVYSLLAIFSISYDCVAVHRLEACNAHLPRQVYSKENHRCLTRQPVYNTATGCRQRWLAQCTMLLAQGTDVSLHSDRFCRLQ